MNTYPKYITRGTMHTQEKVITNADGHKQTIQQFTTFSLSYIFDCPGCEYWNASLSEENALTTRSLHMRRCCPETLVGAIHEDQFGDIDDQLAEFGDEVAELVRNAGALGLD